jgi:hypothetical protein
VAPLVGEKIAETDKTVATVDTTKDQKTNLKIVTVKKPDGTIVTTETENTDTTTKTDSKTVSTEKKDTTIKETAANGSQATYRLGAFAAWSLPELADKPFQKPDYGVQAAYRLIGPVWLDSTYNFGNKELSLGASVEF